ncbi:unnamed protein product [Owenia fusiformis]|uniref:Protein FAM221A n=1 Tax=Owenia fusiformis TaxID=6347 RepID=A0A8S4PUD3_OWEFU|nr:unnamed protein product [Owenia fusiformis]
MGDRQYHLKFTEPNAGASVDAYLEYRRIVGDDDGGKTFTQEEYDNYKKKVLPMRMKNRLFTSWSNPDGMDCKMIGPETPCFCTHRYKQHKTDFESVPLQRPLHLPCKVKGCKCVGYHYVPLNGSQPIRCRCKHFADEHLAGKPNKCRKAVSCMCDGFYSSFTCGCGNPTYSHKTIVETKEEREKRGHPVGMATPYQAMGGITGFSSLADGYMRLDPSGKGAPSEEWLDQAITSDDNAFLKANVQSIRAHKIAMKGKNPALPDYEYDIEGTDKEMAERMSQMRRPGESELDYYDRRYKEKQKEEAKRARARPALDAGPGKTGIRRGVAPPKSAKSRADQIKVGPTKTAAKGKGMSWEIN